MNANEQVTGQTITLNIIEINGRAVEGVKFLGLLTEAAYGNDDFNLYVRWDVDYGVIRVDRSDTDEALVTVGLARKGKLEAFQAAMVALASRYGTPVVVEADPGVKVTALAAKMLGTYLPSATPALREGVTAEQYAAAQADTHAAASAMAQAATAWVGKPAEDAPSIEEAMAEHTRLMSEWSKPLVAALPVRTPGAAMAASRVERLGVWERAEREIWAGTDRVERMRFPRKMKKSRRKFAIAQMGMAAPRPIRVKHARIAAGGIR